MHCPTCRRDNPATTRFCRACGAVLVESAPDGGRRRVLRPWGMRRTAPPTISPDLFELAPAGMPARGTRLDSAFRFDIWIAGGLVVALGAAVWISGTGRPSRDGARAASTPVAEGAPVYASATAPPIVQEIRLEAPPLIDVPPAATPTPVATRRATALAPLPARGKADGVAVIPVAVAAASRASVIDDRPGEVSAPPVSRVASMAPPAHDRWQPLRSALAQCGSVDGALARAMCEQEGRLAHCDGYWGLVAVCPTTRSEFGQ